MKTSYCRCPGCGTCGASVRAEKLIIEKAAARTEAAKLRSLLWEAYDVLKRCGQSDYADKMVKKMKREANEG